MSVITSGKTFANGEQLSADKLNLMLTGATFDNSAVDLTSTFVNSDGAIVVKDGGISTAKIADSNVTTAKIADSNVTKAKIENLADYKVLGNVSGGAAAPAEVAILDEDDMTSDSATSLATQQSIKAYVDSRVPTYVALTGGTVALTQTTNGTYTYTKSDFTGTGLDTTNIHGLYVIARGSSRVSGNFVTVDYTMPDGTIQEVFRTDSQGSPEDHTTTNASTLFLPVGSSQSSIVLTLDSNVGSNNAPSPKLRFEIIAAMQT